MQSAASAPFPSDVRCPRCGATGLQDCRTSYRVPLFAWHAEREQAQRDHDAALSASLARRDLRSSLSIDDTFELTDSWGNENRRVTLRIWFDCEFGYPATWDEPGQGDSVTLRACARVGDDGALIEAAPGSWWHQVAEVWVGQNTDRCLDAARGDGPDPDELRDRALDREMMDRAS